MTYGAFLLEINFAWISKCYRLPNILLLDYVNHRVLLLIGFEPSAHAFSSPLSTEPLSSHLSHFLSLHGGVYG